jgi:nucleotidyltransferase substrate binding protein (TIGR01987 family)
MSLDVRWKQRFENFERAMGLLDEVVQRGLPSLSRLEKEGSIQRFEITFELGWKLMRDSLEASGMVIAPVTPRTVIKEAFGAKLLQDAQVWIDMMLSRNLLSHSYDLETFEAVLKEVESRYFAALERLRSSFATKMASP